MSFSPQFMITNLCVAGLARIEWARGFLEVVKTRFAK
jgi:hypothetical protein